MTKSLTSCAVACVLAATPALAQFSIDLPGVEVRVGPDKGDQSADPPVVNAPANGAPAAAATTYRIGVAGGDVSPELRAHLGLEGVGVLVRQVTPGGAAAQAGVQQHDILLAADGAPLTTIQDLVDIVLAAGPKGNDISLRLLRRGKEVTVTVTPEAFAAPEPPVLGAGPRAPFDLGALPGFGGGEGQPFGQFNQPFAIGGGQRTVIINGVSATVQTQDGKTSISAKRGEETWQLDAADKASLDKLPPDVRQVVDAALGSGGGVRIDLNPGELGPLIEGLMNQRGAGGANGGGELRDRMMQLFGGLLEDRQNGAAQPAAPDAAPPAVLGGEAPIFEPGDALDPAPPAGPVEIEIPAEGADGE